MRTALHYANYPEFILVVDCSNGPLRMRGARLGVLGKRDGLGLVSLKNEWITIPEFGGWEHNPPGSTNYSMEFSQARANRKKRKADVWRSLGNELDLTADSLRQDTQDSVF
ncbi:hypothetical protein Godav_000018, partial [Gossypium davidsonii]|nr:hypothetical protein [Gossypium davidsonii]